MERFYTRFEVAELMQVVEKEAVLLGFRILGVDQSDLTRLGQALVGTPDVRLGTPNP